MPYAPIAALPTPRIAAFSPGLSPPAVRMPIVFAIAALAGLPPPARATLTTAGRIDKPPMAGRAPWRLSITRHISKVFQARSMLAPWFG
jgi:hypothetical protein